MEPRLISPMLDNFAMGGAISDHDGVRCYPAMENDTDDKYIIKVISIPASPTQLEALLLTGAYADKEAALVYFKDLADGVVEEIQILSKLSGMEGFLPYRDFQTVPMENDSGYEVYMLSPYKRTLSKQFVRHPLTQLQAINLGLDLCAALAVCRRAGYLYIALKPNNVYVTPENQFKIGDLGFVSLKSLKYASLPDKYRSAYTAPEIADAFASLNSTIDVYAAGLILYQAYNNGALPDTEAAGSEPFPPPAYADYEMSEIILKACAPNPEDRWQDPIAMGQALVSYMQKHGADDIPIIPPVPVSIPSDAPPEETEDTSLEAPPGEMVPEPEETEEIPPDVPSEEASAEPEITEETSEVPQEDASPETETDEDTASEEIPQEKVPLQEAEPPETPEPSEAPSEGPGDQELDGIDFTDEDPEDLDIDYEDVSDEVNEMLAQADELANHPVPDPVIQPDPIDVPIPDPVPPEPEQSADEAENTAQEAPDAEDSKKEDQGSSDAGRECKEESSDGSDAQAEEKDVPRKKSRWVRITAIVVLVAALLGGSYYFYKNYYLLPINSITLDGDKDTLTVTVDTDVDQSLLSVICADTYGTKISVPLADGKAVFRDLVPNTSYTITLSASGFHHLSGTTSSTYSTPVQTEIVQFSAVTGQEDGSVILNLTIEGPDASQWIVTYSAEEEEEQTVALSSHTATVTGLTLGKEYTFRLAPENDLYLTGSTEVKHTASKLVYAQDLRITSCENNSLTAVWSAPEDVSVDSWSVRCYDGEAYNKTLVVQEPTVTFEGLDFSKGYTVEVTAAGMSVAETAAVSPDPITVKDFQVDTSNPRNISLSWASSHPVPEGGWVLSYTIDGSSEQESMIAEENSATLKSAVPGATYRFTMKTTGDNTVVGLPTEVKMPDAEDFSCSYDGYLVTSNDMIFSMCKTPGVSNWTRKNLSDSDYTTTFAPGQKASFLVQMGKSYGTSSDTIVILYVIRDGSGNFVSADTQSQTWSDMWYRNFCELDIPSLPSAAGNYTISTYFNGALANRQNFVITE